MQGLLRCAIRQVYKSSKTLSAGPAFSKGCELGLYGIREQSQGTKLLTHKQHGIWKRWFASSPWPSPARRPGGLQKERTRVNSDGYTHFARQNSPSGQQPFMRYVLYAVGGGTVYYIYRNIDYAPFTGRVRILGVSRESELKLGQQAYEDILHGFGNSLLAPDHQLTLRVRRVVTRLARSANKIDSKLAEGFKWSVAVADVAEPNAMCVPGGKIVITTGLIRILSCDDDIAIVLGHEIAHALNRHGVESMSLQRLLLPLVMIINQVFDVRFMSSIFVTLFLSLPYSRRLEHEADSVGLLIATEACYDPRVAPGVFQRLGALQNEKGMSKVSKLSSFLSTHPHTEERAQRLQKQLADRVERYNSKCVHHSSNFGRFSREFGRV